MKSAVLVSVLALTAFAVWEESALARNYLNCLSKKVVIVDAPKGTTSSSIEEHFGFWIDEATKIVTLADGKKLNVRRFDDGWISAVSGDVSYELDRQNGNLTYAGSTMKDGIATIIIGAGRCTGAAAPALRRLMIKGACDLDAVLFCKCQNSEEHTPPVLFAERHQSPIGFVTAFYLRGAVRQLWFCCGWGACHEVLCAPRFYCPANDAN